MQRGKYDRAAARARREQATLPKPLVDDPFNQGGISPLAETKRQLAQALERVHKLESICRTHGLLIDE